MFYAKAQNQPNKEKIESNDWVNNLNEGEYDKVRIAPYAIILGLIAIYLKLEGRRYRTLKEVDKFIAVSNYYKFSLVKKNNSDLNPDSFSKVCHNANDYFKLNDELIKLELELLKPKVIFTFKGRQVKRLREIVKELNLETSIIPINDPAWILRGGSGCLKKKGSWYRELKDDEAEKLIDNYSDQIKNYYLGKKKRSYDNKSQSVEIYLKKYYSDWLSKN